MGFSRGLKNEFETAVVNEPSMLEPLKVYCIGERERDGRVTNWLKLFGHTENGVELITKGVKLATEGLNCKQMDSAWNEHVV